MTNLVDITQRLADEKRINLEFGLLVYLNFRESCPSMAPYVLKQLGITAEEADNHPLIKDATSKMLPKQLFFNKQR